MIKYLSIVAVILVAILAGMFISDYMRLPEKTLVIFYTSNLRGQLKPFKGTIQNRQYDKLGGLAFIRGFINESSSLYGYKPEDVYLLDTGDALFGTAEATLTMGDIPLRIMGKTGYDAMAIGNFEFEYGFEQLRSFIKSGAVPMLACNYRDLSLHSGRTFSSGIIVEKNGIKLGIVGLGNGFMATNTRAENIVNLEIEDYKASVHNAAVELKQKGAELIVLLSHHPVVGSLPKPQEVFPEVDIIIGDLIADSSSITARPMMCQTAAGRGGGLGMVKIAFANGKWQLEKGINKIFAIDADKIKPDSELNEEINRVEAKIEGRLDEVITECQDDFSTNYNEESQIGSLIADCMRQTTGSDVALTNSGGIKSTLQKGPVTLRSLYDIVPFENSLVTVELSGWQLESLIEASFYARAGFLQTSGLTCSYSPENPDGFKLIQIDVNGEPLEYDRVYTAAVNDFMFSNNHDWPELSFGKTAKVCGLVREELEKYLRAHKLLAAEKSKRFSEIDNTDEALRLMPLTYEIASLTKPVANDFTTNSEYARLVAEVIRLEAKTDFAFVPLNLLNRVREPLSVVHPRRVIADFKTHEGVKIIQISGAMLQQLIDAIFTSRCKPMAFSGLSVEEIDGKKRNLILWGDNFDSAHMYKAAVPESFVKKVEGAYDFSASFASKETKKCCEDIRRFFMNGLRIRKGQVELKRVLY